MYIVTDGKGGDDEIVGRERSNGTTSGENEARRPSPSKGARNLLLAMARHNKLDLGGCKRS